MNFHDFASVPVSGAGEDPVSGQKPKTSGNERNSIEINSESVAHARNTPSNAPEPSRIEWAAQTGPRVQKTRKSKKEFFLASSDLKKTRLRIQLTRCL